LFFVGVGICPKDGCSGGHVLIRGAASAIAPIQPPNSGKVIAIPQVDGLHHRYERLAA
jgi:hypothetical protein